MHGLANFILCELNKCGKVVVKPRMQVLNDCLVLRSLRLMTEPMAVFPLIIAKNICLLLLVSRILQLL